jgi:hypothetical protein
MERAMTHTKTDTETDSAIKLTTETRAPNLSTEHQKEGDARRPAEQLDRNQGPGEDDGGRKTSFTDNA